MKKKLNFTKNSVTELKTYLNYMTTKTKLKCLGVITLALISSILASIWPLRLGELYTSISNGDIKTIDQGFTSILAFGAIYLFAECITILRRVLLDCIVATHEAEIRETSVEKLLKMPVSYYSDCLSGEKTAQLNQGVAGFSQLIKILCNDIFATVLTATCTLIQLIANAPFLMAGIMLTYLVVVLLVSAFQIRSQNGIREAIITQKNSLDGQICQAISNLELIRSMSAEKYEKERLHPAILKVSFTEKKHHCYMGKYDCMKQFCKIVFQVIVLLVSIILVTNGKMSTGTVISVCMLFQQLLKPIDEVYRFMDETASSIVKAKVLTEVMNSNEDDIFSIVSQEQPMTDSDIVLKDVTITEPKKELPLAHYDTLHIPGNEIVALSGISGSGKTTAVRSLTRFYPYVSGSITLFGCNLKNYNQKDLVNKLFYVPPKSFFFAGTIRDNLIYGLERKVTEEEMYEALKKAGLYDVLVSKSNAQSANNSIDILSYEIGEGSSGLSSGESQRLSLARAFLRKPKVFILDESTANLDKPTANMVLTNIEAYAKEIGAGIVYISHDEHVIKRCTKVISINNLINLDSENLVVA